MTMRCKHCGNDLSEDEASGDKCPYCHHPFVYPEAEEEPEPRRQAAFGDAEED